MRRNPPPASFKPQTIDRMVSVVNRQSDFITAISKKVTEKDLVQAAVDYIGDNSNEFALAVFTDSPITRVLAYSEFTSGSARSVATNLTSVVRDGLLCNADACFFFHQHPNGDPIPSPADIDLSAALASLMKVFDMQLKDSMVLGDSAFSSITAGMLVPYAQAGIRRRRTP
jgi:DNA repair protein RadC